MTDWKDKLRLFTEAIGAVLVVCGVIVMLIAESGGTAETIGHAIVIVGGVVFLIGFLTLLIQNIKG